MIKFYFLSNTTELHVFILKLIASAARFGDLEPFGQFFEPFGAQYFDLAIFKFGSFLGSFLKLSKKTVLTGF